MIVFLSLPRTLSAELAFAFLPGFYLSFHFPPTAGNSTVNDQPPSVLLHIATGEIVFHATVDP